MLRGARDASGLARVPIDLDVLGEEDGRGVPAGTSVGHRSDQRRGFGNAFLNDPDGDSDDGALDLEQKQAVDDDLNAITADLRKQLRDKKKRGAGYVNLFQYLFFCMFYFVVVFMQADVYNAYSVVSSVRRAVVPLDGDGYPVSAMANPTEILDWLVDTAFPVWTDEICGDGVCNEPFEFPAYGRFGCRSDCGSNTNLTTILLQVRADFRDDLYAPRALMSAASWNLCKRDEAAKKAGFPDVCWWEDDRMFNKIVENHLETVNVPPDELWFVSVKGDYMGRVVGNIFIAENNSLPWVGTVPEWKACARNVVSSRREVATNNARRMLLDVEKHEAEVLAAFPWASHTVSILTVEDPTAPVAAQLSEHGYKELCRLHEKDTLFVHWASWRKHPLVRRILSGEKALTCERAGEVPRISARAEAPAEGAEVNVAHTVCSRSPQAVTDL